MTPEELRLECLKLVMQGANASGIPLETNQLISRARAYADFVMNQTARGGADNVNGAPVRKMNLAEGGRDTSTECLRLNPAPTTPSHAGRTGAE
jgi:hypothetical protein